MSIKDEKNLVKYYNKIENYEIKMTSLPRKERKRGL